MSPARRYLIWPPAPLSPNCSTVLYFMLLTTVLLYFHRPTRSTGSADTRWPAATAADPDKKQTCHTAFINVAGSRGASRPFPRKTLPHNFPHRCGNPAALLVRSPGKPCHTTFITVAAFRGASRTFWSQYPRAPTTGLLKNPSFCTATRDPSREPSREPSKTQPPQGLSPFTLHCLLHDFVGLSPLPLSLIHI